MIKSTPRIVRFGLALALACIGGGTLFTGCASGRYGQGESVVVTEEGEPGGMVLTTTRTTATVTALDPATRGYTLRRADGKEAQFIAGPEMVNYPQLRVGDRVTATQVEQIALYLRPQGSEPKASESKVVQFAPAGGKPGIYAVRTSELTARVWTVNASKRQVTLKLGDGELKKFKVRPSVELNRVKPGDVVVAGLTESVKVEVASP